MLSQFTSILSGEIEEKGNKWLLLMKQNHMLLLDVCEIIMGKNN